ncbi:hypothetical protein CERZMDRAFT_86726 [Cercospora zeae-maydis SCOH1-5]|uniref:Uncharacterized protein n=1 Tax=Cercospora zeae-maydis SCOH1-5 TaxID=717836 RepID=A0A6A6F7Z5_9PEZI|nr:hypothetical protein CERZMDRAFT_86726 [Cercospora zeae-maydis SCOH1-5]
MRGAEGGQMPMANTIITVARAGQRAMSTGVEGGRRDVQIVGFARRARGTAKAIALGVPDREGTTTIQAERSGRQRERVRERRTAHCGGGREQRWWCCWLLRENGGRRGGGVWAAEGCRTSHVARLPHPRILGLVFLQHEAPRRVVRSLMGARSPDSPRASLIGSVRADPPCIRQPASRIDVRGDDSVALRTQQRFCARISTTNTMMMMNELGSAACRRFTIPPRLPAASSHWPAAAAISYLGLGPPCASPTNLSLALADRGQLSPAVLCCAAPASCCCKTGRYWSPACPWPTAPTWIAASYPEHTACPEPHEVCLSEPCTLICMLRFCRGCFSFPHPLRMQPAGCILSCRRARVVERYLVPVAAPTVPPTPPMVDGICMSIPRTHSISGHSFDDGAPAKPLACPGAPASMIPHLDETCLPYTPFTYDDQGLVMILPSLPALATESLGSSFVILLPPQPRRPQLSPARHGEAQHDDATTRGALPLASMIRTRVDGRADFLLLAAHGRKWATRVVSPMQTTGHHGCSRPCPESTLTRSANHVLVVHLAPKSLALINISRESGLEGHKTAVA